MDRVARRHLTAAAAAALVAATPTVLPSLPSAQVRGVHLAANVSDLLNAQLNTLYTQIQQEVSAHAAPGISIAELFTDHDSGDPGMAGLAPGGEDLTLDTNSVNQLIGPGFDPTVVDGTTILSSILPDASSFDAAAPGGIFSANEQVVSAFANFASFSAADMIPVMQTAYQTFTNAVVAAELAVNAAIVNAQMSAAEHLVNSGEAPGDFVSWVFSANNATLAEHENMLNSLLGVNFDPDAIHSSLVGAFSAEGMGASDWAALLGIDSAQLSQFVEASGVSDFLAWLTGMDWTTLFSGLF